MAEETFFHIKEATVFLRLSADAFCRWPLKQQRKFKGSKQISAAQYPEICIFKLSLPAVQLCMNLRLVVFLQEAVLCKWETKSGHSIMRSKFPPPAVVLQRETKRERQILFPPQTSPVSNHILWSLNTPSLSLQTQGLTWEPN